MTAKTDEELLSVPFEFRRLLSPDEQSRLSSLLMQRMSHEEFRQVLIDAGIFDADGELTPYYRGETHEH